MLGLGGTDNAVSKPATASETDSAELEMFLELVAAHRQRGQAFSGDKVRTLTAEEQA